MIEIFKTDVIETYRAREIVTAIHLKYPHYQANFDLDDCDRILRIVSPISIEIECLKTFLQALDCHAEILSEEIHPG